MGKPKTETVGGGAASPVAQDWNKFLQQGLSTGNFGGSPGPNGASTGVGQAAGQSNAFGNAINGMLGGRPGDPNSYEQYFQQIQHGGNGGYTFGAAPGFQSTEFQNPGSAPIAPQLNFGSPVGVGGAHAQGFGVNFNSQNYGTPANVFGANGAGDLLHYDVNSPEFAALKALNDRQTQQGVADLRARFGTGGTSLGSGASLAESQYLAEANPRNTLALGDLGRQMQMLDMQNRGQNAQALLGQRAQNIDMRGQNMNTDLGAAQGTAANQTQASIASANNATQAGIASMQGRLQQTAMQLQAMGMDADNAFRTAQAMNQNNFAQNQAHNQFDQGNYQFGVNAGMQNQNMMNNYGLAQGQFGLGLMGQQSQAQSDMLSRLFGAYGQSNQLGTAQAQTVQTPSAFGQVMGALGDGLNLFGQFKQMGNPFGGNGGNVSGGGMQFGAPPQIAQTPGYPQFPGVVNPSHPIAPPIGYNPFMTMPVNPQYQLR